MLKVAWISLIFLALVFADDKTSVKRFGKNKILPKTLPYKDTEFLLSFHSDNNDVCEQMEPVVQRLEEEMNVKVRRINAFRRREFFTLLEAMGHDECGNLPFYYNRRSAQAVCGATTYKNLKLWAGGSDHHLFNDPPENIHEQEENKASRRSVGFAGFWNEKIASLESTGKAKAAEETAKAAAKNKDNVVEGPTTAAERTAQRRKEREERQSSTEN